MFLTLQGPELDLRGSMKPILGDWIECFTGRELGCISLGLGVQIWVGIAFFSSNGGLQPCVLAGTMSTCVVTPISHIQLKSLSWRRAPPLLLVLHPNEKIIKVWEGKCLEFVTGDFPSPALISHPRASIFLFSSGFINVSGALEKNAHLAAVVRHSSHICYLGKRIFFFVHLFNHPLKQVY